MITRPPNLTWCQPSRVNQPLLALGMTRGGSRLAHTKGGSSVRPGGEDGRAALPKGKRDNAFTTDGVGFEPTVRYERTHTFQACALNHSATRPNIVLRRDPPECLALDGRANHNGQGGSQTGSTNCLAFNHLPLSSLPAFRSDTPFDTPDSQDLASPAVEHPQNLGSREK